MHIIGGKLFGKKFVFDGSRGKTFTRRKINWYLFWNPFPFPYYTYSYIVEEYNYVYAYILVVEYRTENWWSNIICNILINDCETESTTLIRNVISIFLIVTSSLELGTSRIWTITEYNRRLLVLSHTSMGQ